MSTEAGGTAAPVTPLHPEHANTEPQRGDAPALPIEIHDDGESIDDLLELAETALGAAQVAIAVNEQQIFAAAGDPSAYRVPLQVSALEHAVVSSAATQLVIARALVTLCERIDHLGVALVRERTGIDEQLEEFLKLFRA